jgi:hypothetical protein
MPEAEDAVEEEQRPPHEQGNHEPVDDVHHVIDLTAVGGKVFGNA